MKDDELETVCGEGRAVWSLGSFFIDSRKQALRIESDSGHFWVVLVNAKLEGSVSVEHIHYAYFVVAEVKLDLAQIDSKC